jgi:ornithine carbamoyltransferase
MTPSAPVAALASKDFLSILDLTRAELTHLLDVAAVMKRERGSARSGRRPLAGKHVALLFEKPSLRTRLTFVVAVHELGGEVIEPPADVVFGGREAVEDVARNLERWIAGVVVRTYAQAGLAAFAAAAPGLHVVNALTNEEHPCQVLADMLTLRERFGRLHGRTLAYVGDGNNVARSLAVLGELAGVEVVVAAPPGYQLEEGHGATLTDDPRAAAEGADALYTDVWVSMGDEAEAERRRADLAPFRLDADLLAAARDDAVVLHCLPAHPGEEIAADVLYSDASAVWDQAENRLHAQKALLEALLVP